MQPDALYMAGASEKSRHERALPRSLRTADWPHIIPVTGKRRLPVRRFPSKRCAALVLSRRLRMDGPNSSLSTDLLDVPRIPAAPHPRAKFRAFAGAHSEIKPLIPSPRIVWMPRRFVGAPVHRARQGSSF